jgi:energy-coupling factor transporter ATP-binding protein EcfA2
MIDTAVEFSEVTKQYRHFTLDRINLKLPTGCIMGFVGANGAGKSTTLRILMGLVHQDTGSVKVLGHAMPEAQAAAKREIGLCLRICASTAPQPSSGISALCGPSTRIGTVGTPIIFYGDSICSLSRRSEECRMGNG